MRLEPYDDEWLTNEKMMSLVRGDLKLKKPVKLRHAMGGRQPSDLMRTTLLDIIVISARVVQVLETNSLTGWMTYPVEVHDKTGKILPGYYGLSITGRAGVPDRARGRVINKPPIVSGGTRRKVLQGLYFKNDKWGGSDFCFVGYGGVEIVTHRVVDVFKRAKIRNVELTPLPEYEVSIDTLKNIGDWPAKK